MYWLWFRLAYYDKDLKISVWDKKITRTVNKTVWVKDDQWLEFRSKYKTIKDSWLSDNALIVKYNKLCKEWLHQKIMDNLEDYKKHLELEKWKGWLMAKTYLWQRKAYLDNWEIVKVNYEEKWQDEMLKELKVTQICIEQIIWERDKWKATHTNKELTTYVFREMIKKYYINNK